MVGAIHARTLRRTTQWRWWRAVRLYASRGGGVMMTGCDKRSTVIVTLAKEIKRDETKRNEMKRDEV